MATQDQLRREIMALKEQKHAANKKLRIAVESRRDMANIGMKRRRQILMEKNEKKQLMRELKELKNPKSTAFKRILRKGLRSGGRAGGRGLKKLWDALPA